MTDSTIVTRCSTGTGWFFDLLKIATSDTIHRRNRAKYLDAVQP
jgi:hypothetical protein